MSRKVLIGILSAAFDKNAKKYVPNKAIQYHGEEISSTSFTTIACIQELMPDSLIMIVSDGASQIVDTFEEQLKANGYHNSYLTIRIDDNVSDAMMWKVYDDLYDKIQDGDEIYLDVTGGKRPVSTIMLEVVNYVRRIKRNIVLKDIYYADAFSEKKFYQIRKFVDLTEWAIGVQNYIDYGDAFYLKKVIEDEDKNSSGYKLVYALDKFSRYLEVCQWKGAYEEYEKIQLYMNDFFSEGNDSEFNKKLSVLKENLEQKFEKYKENIFEGSIEWCLDHRNYQQALTLLNEFFQKYLLIKEYFPNDDSIGIFKNKVMDAPVKWYIVPNEDEKWKYKVSVSFSSPYIFYKEIEEYINSIQSGEELSFDMASKLLNVKIKKNKKEYKFLQSKWNALDLYGKEKTLEWYLSKVLAGKLEKSIDVQKRNIEEVLGLKGKILNNFLLISTKASEEEFDSKLRSFLEYHGQEKAYAVYEKDKNHIRQLFDQISITSGAINRNEEDLEKEGKSFDCEKAGISFGQSSWVQTTQEFITQMDYWKEVFESWNIIRVYRNHLDHAQLLKDSGDFDFLDRIDNHNEEFIQNYNVVLNSIKELKALKEKMFE